jgi:PEP-CTERM motif
MTMKKTVLSLSMFLLAVFLPVAPASADTITLALSNPAQTGAPGSTLIFDATVFAPLANGTAVFLNSDNYNVSIPGATIDDSGFFLNFPFSLNPGDNATGTLFSVMLPLDVAVGTYNGFFEILGGSGADSQDLLATVDFQINTVPEPGTGVLFATGFGVLAAWMFGRRRRPQVS